MNPSVQEQAPEVIENVGSDIFSDITGDLLPKTFPESPEEKNNETETGGQPEAPENTDSAVDVSDLIPKVEPKVTKDSKTRIKKDPVKDSQSLSPEDVVDMSALAGDDMPDDLIKEEEAEKVFKGDVKAKDAFLKERAYNKTLREQLKEAQSALMAAQTDAATAEEIEKYKAELEKYKVKAESLESDIGKLDLTRSPAFRQQYDDKINQLGGKIVQLLQKEGVDQLEASNFARQLIAEQKPSVRERLIDDMAPGLRGTLSALGLQIDEVMQTRAAALENWKATAAAMDETESRKRVAEMTGKVDEFVVSAVEEARKLGNPYYVETKDSNWNDQVTKRQTALKGILLSGDMSKIASLVAEGLTAADLRIRYANLLKQKRELESELGIVVKGAPRFSGRVQGPSTYNSEPKRDEVHAVPLEDAITNDLLPPKPR